ncbi:YopX family protein [Helcococcus bovis]|uniref:YopX family protein n=1 Tax=Helcococcus bovis TaxID=3153252 RepID=UPI0038B925CE
MIPKFRAYSKNYGMRKVTGLTYSGRGIYACLENYTGTNIRTKVFELMQNTTFKDINGREVYEGDIVETIPEIEPSSEFDFEWAIVKFDGLEFYLEYFVKRFDKESLKDISIDLEVIGNIYENKDLLEVK